MSMTDGLLHRAAERIWLLPPEEERDRPVLGYVHGDRWSLQIDAGASPAHLALFHRVLAEQGPARPGTGGAHPLALGPQLRPCRAHLPVAGR